ncbi:hypothetical protein VCHA44O286_50066 [Vibrio chagasii]|nr:hypothetical protein VCHA44O286_50066 [Vibrio chagasii]
MKMKKILITCATSNMGSALAKRLSADNELCLAARDTEKLGSIVEAIGTSEHHSVLTHQLDFFDKESIDQCADDYSEVGGLDGLVFIIPRIPPSNSVFPDDEAWKELYEKYFILPLRLIKKLVENSALNSGCKIVLISGLSSKNALTHYSTNNCLRSAWVGQAKTMALSLASQKISVNTISLGGVMTESYTQKMRDKAEVQGISFEDLMVNEVANIPLRKYASVDDVTEAVIALLGPLANHMTGQNILLDGGFNKAY